MFHFNCRRMLLVENIVYRITNRHVYMVVFIHFVEAIYSVIAFGNHVHFQLCRFYGVTFTYHITKRTVTAKLGVSSNHQIAQVGRLFNIAIDRMYSINKA